MLIDTGACVSCMSEKFLHKLGLNIQNDSNKITDTLISADGQTLKVKGRDVVLGTRTHTRVQLEYKFVVLELVSYSHAMYSYSYSYS